jgi:hypothetical protein
MGKATATHGILNGRGSFSVSHQGLPFFVQSSCHCPWVSRPLMNRSNFHRKGGLCGRCNSVWTISSPSPHCPEHSGPYLIMGTREKIQPSEHNTINRNKCPRDSQAIPLLTMSRLVLIEVSDATLRRFDFGAPLEQSLLLSSSPMLMPLLSTDVLQSRFHWC